MNKDKIKSIALNNFRGATKPLEIKFNPKKSMIMIFGENGTGKSTLIDAIDFIFNKKAGSLTEKSSTNIKRHLPALGAKPQDIDISITSQNQKKWNGKLNGETPKITGNDDYLSVEILRRDKILKLVNAEPKKRYDTFLENFIELPNIRSSENTLRESIREINRNINDETLTNQKQKDTLQKSWKGEGEPGNNYFEWAEEKSKQHPQELKEKVAQYKKCINFIEKCFEFWNSFKEVKEKLSLSKNNLDIAKQKLKEQSQKSLPEEIIDILEKTQTFLQKGETKECPACEQPIESEKLKERISVRLKDIKELATATKKHKQTENQYKDLKRDFIKQQKELTNSIKNLVKFLRAEDLDLEIQKITKKIEEYQFLFEEEIDFKKGEAFFKDKASFLQKIKNINEADDKTLYQLNLIKVSFQSLKETKQKIQKLSNKLDYLDKILKIIENERKTYVEDLLSNISNDVEELYSKLHPNEGFDNIRLYLKPKVQGSLEIKSSFQSEKDVPPQAYFSDSHLDTLGICMVIARAKFFKADIIVLDDVVTSLDQQHLDRFIKMLSDEIQYFNQIILTTHYRPWREKYKFHREPNSNVQLIELSSFWSVNQGIKSAQTKLSITELEDIKNKNPFDRQIAGSKAGIFLESLLDRLTLLYSLKAPRKPEPIYTLGELISCFSNKFIEKMKIRKNTGDEILLSDTIEDIFRITEPIRNKVGCHWNNIGQYFSDHDIMSFLEKTIEFGKIFICSQCGGLPQKKKTDCWQCSCGKTSLYPLSK